MSNFLKRQFVIAGGTARTVVSIGLMGDDSMAVMYSPTLREGQPEKEFIKFHRHGEFVRLTENTPLVLLDLPGTYFIEPEGSLTFPDRVSVSTSDESFPFTLTGTY